MKKGFLFIFSLSIILILVWMVWSFLPGGSLHFSPTKDLSETEPSLDTVPDFGNVISGNGEVKTVSQKNRSFTADFLLPSHREGNVLVYEKQTKTIRISVSSLLFYGPGEITEKQFFEFIEKGNTVYVETNNLAQDGESTAITISLDPESWGLQE